MSEYEDTNDNASTQSLDNESEGLDISIIQTVGAQKAVEAANENPRRSSREKNPVSRFGYNDYMAYHYAYMMKVNSVRGPETFSEAAKNPRWIATMNEEMEALCKNETWDLVPHTPHNPLIPILPTTSPQVLRFMNLSVILQ